MVNYADIVHGNFSTDFYPGTGRVLRKRVERRVNED
jgi:hypothetical protein